MSAQNKAKGSRWESDVENFFNECGLKARRLPRNGSKDIGDVAVELAQSVLVIEAKNVKDAAGQMAQFLREAEVEAHNYDCKYGAPTVGVVVTKTRQKGVGEGRVTMTLDTLVELLRWNGAA